MPKATRLDMHGPPHALAKYRPANLELFRDSFNTHTQIANMGRGPKKHQKRLSAPSHWLLDKLSGAYAPKASPGPHKLRDCMPLIVFIRNRLKYALNGREVKQIVMQRLIKVDGKVRTRTLLISKISLWTRLIIL